ncbi:helix-turn-helix transcriptional regulator [Litorisediminicola beolgyonensis]|uniref:Helix-turn-helix transcriptional regulator n=1 Tax=Litorisediminicola beolgyonensis TaxID=1173614 RepID=A0ABW3ZE63_9RHOB
MTDHPPLDRWRFDAITTGPEKLWGLETIARALGISVSTARRWAKNPRIPIRKVEGAGYLAIRSELNAWLSR